MITAVLSESSFGVTLTLVTLGISPTATGAAVVAVVVVVSGPLVVAEKMNSHFLG